MLNLSSAFFFSTPVFLVFLTSIVVMMFDLFKPQSRGATALSILGLFSALGICCFFYPNVSSLLWSDLFVVDNATLLMQIFILLTVGLSIYFSSSRLPSLDSQRGDILSLYLLSTVGMMCLVAAQTFLSIYISLELTSLPLYALVASQRNSAEAIEAAVKYFVMGAVASVFILFGISILYGLTGFLDLSKVSKVLELNDVTQSMMILFALILIISGASFKLALVPFHMWIPDVYAGANPVMTLFLSAAPKIAGFAIFLRFAISGMFDILPLTHHILAFLALISIIFGNLCALVQKDLRRLLAYSTISHMGYAVLGFVAGGHNGETAALFYILAYSLMTVAGFSAILISKDEQSSLLTVADLQGLSKTTPWLAAMLMIVFFSMAGIPPAIGFFAKFFVIRALVDSSMYFYAFLALIFAVVGMFYYLKLIKTMYFDSPQEFQQTIDVSIKKRFVYMLQVFLLLGLGLMPNILISACLQAF
jgi:NADH-quinone oxidoreductase subunit N